MILTIIAAILIAALLKITIRGKQNSISKNILFKKLIFMILAKLCFIIYQKL